MKGIFFSLDALLALLVAFLLTGAILQAIAALPAEPDNSRLLKISGDSLAIMEKTGTLEDSVSSSSSNPIKLFARSIPRNICYRVSISKPPASNPLIAEENCPCKTFSVARRSFLIASSASTEYLAEMRACYK